MSIKGTLTINMSDFIDPFVAELAAQSGHASKLFPETQAKLSALGDELERSWRSRAHNIPGTQGRPLRIGPYVGLDRDQYAGSITKTEHAMSGATIYDATIGSRDPQAELIEAGTPGGKEIDLHDVLPYAKKARRSKEGHTYLRIPLRHAESSLSSGVVRAMANKPKYLSTGQTGVRPSANYGHIMIRKYSYTSAKAAQIKKGELQAIRQRARTHKLSETQIGRLTGLMRVGAKGHGQYLTIRTLSEKDKTGWRIPAYKAQNLKTKTQEEGMKKLQAGFLRKALEADGLAIAAQAGVGL